MRALQNTKYIMEAARSLSHTASYAVMQCQLTHTPCHQGLCVTLTTVHPSPTSVPVCHPFPRCPGLCVHRVYGPQPFLLGASTPLPRLVHRFRTDRSFFPGCETDCSLFPGCSGMCAHGVWAPPLSRASLCFVCRSAQPSCHHYRPWPLPGKVGACLGNTCLCS